MYINLGVIILLTDNIILCSETTLETSTIGREREG